MIDVKEITSEDGKTSFIISWDENDPGESIFNSFTEQDFIDLLMYYSKRELDKIENNSSTEEEYRETDDAYEDYIQASYEVSPYYNEQEEWECYHEENNEAQ